MRVESVPLSHGITVLFCGPYEGLFTHHVHKRSYVCDGASKCNPGLHKTGVIWKGYAPSRIWDARARHWYAGVFEVTEFLEETLRTRDLPGEIWWVKREDPRKKNSPIVGSFLERCVNPQLCEPFDVRPALYRMYHVAELDLGVPNPIAPRIFLPPISAEDLKRPPQPDQADDSQNQTPLRERGAKLGDQARLNRRAETQDRTTPSTNGRQS